MTYSQNFVTYSQSIDANNAAAKLSPAIFEDGYPTPYPLKFAGMLLKTALSTAYDATATPTYPVAIPCGSGERPDGFAYIHTGRTDIYGSQELFTGLDYFLPLVADRTGGGSTYAVLEAKFAHAVLHPLIPGRVIGVPVAATTNIIVGDEIASAAGGLARVAVSTDVVVGKAETAANNAAGAAGALKIWVKVGHQYIKA
jgi:hypothetical protein